MIMNEHGVDRENKSRDVTDEWMTKAWPVFNGYNLKTVGVAKEDILQTLYEVSTAL